MDKLLKLASLLLYSLCLVNFFFLGLFFAWLTEAGKDQGLAGGAIVLSYGLGFALISFFSAIFLSYNTTQEKVRAINKFMVILLLLLLCAFAYRIYST